MAGRESGGTSFLELNRENFESEIQGVSTPEQLIELLESRSDVIEGSEHQFGTKEAAANIRRAVDKIDQLIEEGTVQGRDLEIEPEFLANNGITRSLGLRAKVQELMNERISRHWNPEIAKVSSFEDLYAVIRSQRSITSSGGKEYNPEDQIAIIEELRRVLKDRGYRSHYGLLDVTRAMGIRYKVQDLLRKEK